MQLLNRHLNQRLKNYFHWLEALFANVYYGFPAKKLTVIGVTGTDGKTTTATLIYHVLKSSGFPVALISTVAAYINAAAIDTGFHVTTPSPWQLQKLLHSMVNQKITHLVLEATSHGLDQHRLLGIPFKVAVVTNVTHEHLDYHETYERYLGAKAVLLQQADYAVLNGDDSSFKPLLKYVPKHCKLYPYSRTDNLNPTLLLEEDFRSLKEVIRRSFPEAYNQENAMAAFFAVTSVGLSVSQFSAALPTFKGVLGRMEPIPNSKGIQALVDFAHTPNALAHALKAARAHTRGKLIVVFGAAGQRDTAKRPLMGKVAADLADEVVITAEDPRGEDVRLITEQIKAGATQNRGHLHSVSDRHEAIRFALSLAKPGDTVLVCGKGHEQSLNLDGTHEIPWSDTQEVRLALQ